MMRLLGAARAAANRLLSRLFPYRTGWQYTERRLMQAHLDVSTDRSFFH